MSVARSFIFVFVTIAVQVLSKAVPLIIEINHHKSDKRQIIIDEIEIDDRIVRNAKLQSSKITTVGVPTEITTEKQLGHLQISSDIHYNAAINNENESQEYDTGMYDYNDCAIPVMPPNTIDYKYQTTRDVQIQSQPGHGIISSTVNSVNGIALNVIAIIFNLIEAIPSSLF